MKYELYKSPIQQPKLIGRIKELKPGAQFVEEIGLPLKRGGQTPNVGWVFFEPDHKPEHPPYFAIYRDSDDRWLTISFAPERLWVGALLAPTSDPELTYVVFSRYGHDYVETPEGYMSDGGQYCRGARSGWPHGKGMPEHIEFNMHTLEVRGKNFDVVHPKEWAHLWD